MAGSNMRDKAKAIFGSGFMGELQPKPAGKMVNGAHALQKRANARPIPTYKDGGRISKEAVREARVVNRAQAAGLMKDGGKASKYDAKLERKVADIKKDYEKAKAKGKNADVAKAKYEQRMADAKDDYAKWTKADRTETRAAEKAAEQALKIARRTGGTNIANRDRPSTMSEPMPDVKPLSATAQVGKVGKMEAATPARARSSSPPRAGVTRKAAPAAAPAAPKSKPAARSAKGWSVTAPDRSKKGEAYTPGMGPRKFAPEREAAWLKADTSKFAAGGAAKVRKGQAKPKKGC